MCLKVSDGTKYIRTVSNPHMSDNGFTANEAGVRATARASFVRACIDSVTSKLLPHPLKVSRSKGCIALQQSARLRADKACRAWKCEQYTSRCVDCHLHCIVIKAVSTMAIFVAHDSLP